MLKIIKVIIFCTELSKYIDGGYIEMSKIVKPILNRQDKLIYLCEFDSHVQCFWRKNNRTTSIKPFEYQDKDNTKNTTNCSILAPNLAPAKTFKSKNPELQCFGYLQTATELQKATIGGSIKLECVLPKANRCGWKHSSKAVLITGRYRYTNALAQTEKVTNCSIIINSITAIDSGLWECSSKIFDSTTATVDAVISHNLVFSDSTPPSKNVPNQTESLKILTVTQVTTSAVPIITTTKAMPTEITTMEMTTESVVTKQFVGNIAEVVSPQKFQEMELKIIILLSALGAIFIIATTGLAVYFIRGQRNNIRNLKKRSEESPCDRIVNDLYTITDNRLSRMSNIPSNRELLYSENGSETYLVPIKLNPDYERRIYDMDQHIYEEIPEIVNNSRSPQIPIENKDFQGNSSTIQSTPLPIPINYTLDAQQQSTSDMKVPKCPSDN